MLTDKQAMDLIKSVLELVEVKNAKIFSVTYDLERANEKIKVLEEKINKLNVKEDENNATTYFK